jgi:hypothetical protein
VRGALDCARADFWWRSIMLFFLVLIDVREGEPCNQVPRANLDQVESKQEEFDANAADG